MIPYILVVLLLLFLIIQYDVEKRKIGKELWQWVVVVVLVLMAGLRYHVGTDTPSYEYDYYHTIPYLNNCFHDSDSFSQPLWVLLMSLCKTISGSFVFFQFAHAIIINLLIFRFIKRTTKYVFSSFLLTFCLTWWNLSFEVLRESICVAVYLNAVLLLREHKYVKYIILGLIIIGFHWFGFVIVLITPIVTHVNEKIMISLSVLLAVFLFFFVDTSFFDLLEMLASDHMSGGAQERLDSYLGKEGGQGRASYNLMGMLSVFILSVLFPLLTIFFIKKDERYKYFINIIILFVVVGVLQTKMVIFGRFFNYLYIILIVCCLHVVYEHKIRVPLIRLFYNILVLIFVVYNGIMPFYMPDPSEPRTNIHYNCYHIPYKTIFEEPDPIREAVIR